jgi:hypothetical protein
MQIHVRAGDIFMTADGLTIENKTGKDIVFDYYEVPAAQSNPALDPNVPDIVISDDMLDLDDLIPDPAAQAPAPQAPPVKARGPHKCFCDWTSVQRYGCQCNGL